MGRRHRARTYGDRSEGAYRASRVRQPMERPAAQPRASSQDRFPVSRRRTVGCRPLVLRSHGMNGCGHLRREHSNPAPGGRTDGNRRNNPVRHCTGYPPTGTARTRRKGVTATTRRTNASPRRDDSPAVRLPANTSSFRRGRLAPGSPGGIALAMPIEQTVPH